MTTFIVAAVMAALLAFVIMGAGAACDEFMQQGNDRAFYSNLSLGFLLTAAVFALGWLAGVSS